MQLYPNRITITPQREPLQFHEVKFNKQCPSWYQEQKEQYQANFAVENNPFILSKASKRKLMDSINSMYTLSKPRKIKMKTGKFIYNYRLSFITLTLPSEQTHDDVAIKKECLNQFLIEMRKHYGVKNYVWKAELQKNDNIHFHLIFDKYVDYQALRRRWNRIINKLDYVNNYQKKMSSLTLQEYHNLRSKGNSQNFLDSSKAYAKGKKHNWSRPNSVDVRSVYSKKELAIYLGKYITKKVTNLDNDSATDVRQQTFGRSWSRSYSLVVLKYQNKFLLSEMTNLVNYLQSIPDKVKKLTGDYYTVFYFSAEQLSKAFRLFHQKYMNANALMYDYPFP